MCGDRLMKLRNITISYYDAQWHHPFSIDLNTPILHKYTDSV